MVVKNEWDGTWQIEWPETMQHTLMQVTKDIVLWSDLVDFVHKKFKYVDSFHPDVVTFLWAAENKEDVRECEKEIKKRVCAWITAYC